MILAIADKFKGDDQKIRQHKYLNGQKPQPIKKGKQETIEGMLSATM